MRCPRCQSQNREGASFCEDCGARLEVACPNCGEALTRGKKFCASCGTPVTSPAAVHHQSPRSYTPRHLAEKILTSKAALEGERKQVTVLFADLKGSMELLADRDPEEARKLLDPVLERMMEAVHRYEGTVNQVMGDGIMALFGAPLAHEDHAVRACYAALRMQESIKRYSEGVRRVEGIPIRIRIGLNSGEVVVRTIGSDLHMDYTAIGQTTHLAARMEQIADAGTTLLTSATLALAEGFLEVKSLGPTPVKGLTDPVELFELTGASAVRSRLQAAAARGLTKFVGRSAEMVQLHETLNFARSGRGQIVAVVGEPGVGKSRLLWEFTRSHRTEGCLVVEAASVSYGKATPHLPVVDLLKAYFEIERRDDARKIREKVTGKLFSLDRALEPSLPPLLSLLDVSAGDEQWERLDPPQRRQRMLNGVKRLLLRESEVQPLIVVFEDLHWIDSETQALLDTLADSLPSVRVLLLVNYRPEYQHTWGSRTYYRQIRVDALPPASAEELLDALLGIDGSIAAIKRLLIARTEGNAFFLEESVRTLVESAVLVGERGAYRLTRTPESIEIPPTAQAILAARIDRLDPEDKRVLQAAAVIGKDFSVTLLTAVANAQELIVQNGLERLRAAEFIYETKLYPEGEYTFKHALTHEVAYASLLQERRRDLHALIAETTERLYPDRLLEHVDRLAHHSVRGELWDKAVDYLRQAGLKAVDRSAHREAVAFLDQALRIVDRLPDGHTTQGLSIDLRFDLLPPLLALGELDLRLERLREAEALAETLGDVRRLAWAVIFTSNTLEHMGHTPDAVQTAQRGIHLVHALDDPELAVLAHHYLGQAQYQAGAYGAAAALLRRSVAAFRGDQARANLGLGPLPSVLSRHYLGLCLAELGEFDDAATIGAEAVEIAEAVDHAWSRVLAYYVVAAVDLQRGALETASAIAARSMDVCQTNHLRFLFPQVAALHGYVVVCSGRIGDGISSMERALEASQAMRRGSGEPLRRAHLSEAYLLADRRELARNMALGALQLAEQQGQFGQGAWVYRVLAEIAGLHPSLLPHSAEHYYRETLTRSEALGMRPLVAHCHLGLGKLYRRTSKREQAREHLATAMTMYREMDMRFWLEKVEAIMGALP